MRIKLSYTSSHVVRGVEEPETFTYYYDVFVNRIAFISETTFSKENEKRIVAFSAREDDCLIVDQTREEISRLIDEARNAEIAQEIAVRKVITETMDGGRKPLK